MFMRYRALLPALFLQGHYAFGVGRPLSLAATTALFATDQKVGAIRGGATSNPVYNPSIYGLADHMLDTSLLMYPVASIRKYIRENPDGYFADSESILATPITASEIVEFFVKNEDKVDLVLKDEMKEDLTVVSEILHTVVERQKQKEVTPGEEPDAATLVEFNDEDSKSELVYAVSVNDARKSVTVTFRGSVTSRDWWQDIQIVMKRIANPLVGRKDGLTYKEKQPEDIRIHKGFYDYLFQEDDETKKTKFDEIMETTVKQLKENPGYELYVTGHSLGAALASLFAFMVSSSEEYWDVVPTPVKCVSIASPYVGGSNFRTAFEEMERMDRLRYLRVANQGDIVSIEPFFALNFGFYKHCGVELKLYRSNDRETLETKPNKKFYSLTYPKGKLFARTWNNSIFPNFTLKPLTNHSPDEYSRRLDKTKPKLNSQFLEDFYKNLDL